MSSNILVAINAQYSHTSLSVRSLRAVAKQAGKDVSIREYTINQWTPNIQADLYEAHPAALFFSCYLWNMRMVEELTQNLRQVLPQTLLFLGGPEVSYRAGECLEKLPVDGVLTGEGERSFPMLLGHLTDGVYGDIPGMAYRKDGEILQNPSGTPFDMNSLPFVYENLADVKERILYYESSRGCPFHCSYCLSGEDNTVRAKSIGQTCEDLQRFLDAGVSLVKFVDRTFNYDRRRADEIWTYLMDHDNGKTRFHFELSADLLDERNLALLSRARAGLFQFEIGIQSTNEQTLSAICRTNKNDIIFDRVRRVKQMGNIHQHLDLIACLPKENFQSFRQSFNDVFSLHPEQFQLGFLKVLSGSVMEKQASQYGIRYTKSAPYEAMCSDCLTYEEVLHLKKIEDMVERYLNSNRYDHLLAEVIPKAQTPFDFFDAFSAFYYGKNYQNLDHTRVGYLDILAEFLNEQGWLTEKAQTEARYDWCLKEKPNVRPEWMKRITKEEDEEFLTFYLEPDNIERYLPNYAGDNPRRIARITHMERFDNRTVLFDYAQKDLLGNAKVTTWTEDFPAFCRKK